MPQVRRPRLFQNRGFSLLELLIVIIIISTLLGFAIDRLLKLQVQAERSSLEGMVGIMQSAIALTISEHIVKNKIPALAEYVDSNPMTLLTDPPGNYLGHFDGRPKNLETASWWYDQNSNSLCYYVLNHEYFINESSDKRVIKFKILAVYDDNNNNGQFDNADTLVGLRLAPDAKYRWSNESMEPDA